MRRGHNSWSECNMHTNRKMTNLTSSSFFTLPIICLTIVIYSLRSKSLDEAQCALWLVYEPSSLIVNSNVEKQRKTPAHELCMKRDSKFRIEHHAI